MGDVFEFGESQIGTLLLKLPEEHSCRRLLSVVTQSISEWEDVALVRIWQSLPGDICDRCLMRSECPTQVDCLHLVSSRGHSITDPNANWNKLEGRFARFPPGVRKVGHVAKTGKPVTVNLREDKTWVADSDWAEAEGIKAINAQPLLFHGKVLGVLAIFLRREIDLNTENLQRMIADHLAMAIANAEAFEKIESLKEQLELENEYLRTELEETQSYGDIVGTSEAVKHVVSRIDLVAPTMANVLILGESGTGKELVAREIHRHSDRKNEPLIRVNCAGIPASLFESELFGHAKGSFTGALRDRPGRFEVAAGGTLFLDEIGEIPVDLQAKLLRVLQEGEYERVGEDVTRNVDTRIIAATNRKLEEEVEAGRFREDLYYRLNVFPIEVPSLRKRLEDLALLVPHFVKLTSKKLNLPESSVSKSQLQNLKSYHWPGNIRELQNVLERAMIVSRGQSLRFDFPENGSRSKVIGNSSIPASISSVNTNEILNESDLVELNRANIIRALKTCGGKVYGKDGAAALLELKPNTLASRMKKLGIVLREKTGLI
jgi:transcriptional regulator with GAF, ATPase, and Fis domain